MDCLLAIQHTKMIRFIRTWKLFHKVNSLNIRSGPSIGSAVLSNDECRRRSNYDLVTKGHWVQIIINGINGWVHTDYISAKTG